MPELDVVKEQIAYLKVWLGIMVVTDLSLFGWLITNADSASTPMIAYCVTAIVAVTIGIGMLHRRIGLHIRSLRDL